MFVLCANRPESFGPHSAIHPRLPTTCFLDVIVIPLATWLYLLSGPYLIIYIVRRRHGTRDDDKKPIPNHTLAQKILAGVYYLLFLAMLAMVSLEIARLEIARLGIGLLPFTYVGVILAGIGHVLTERRMTIARGLSALYWIILGVVMALKTAALVQEEGSYNRVGVASKYPLGDEVTDLAVMLGLEIVLALLEVLT